MLTYEDVVNDDLPYPITMRRIGQICADHGADSSEYMPERCDTCAETGKPLYDARHLLSWLGY